VLSVWVALLADEQPGLEVLGDTHYGSGQTRAAVRAWPWSNRPRRRARADRERSATPAGNGFGVYQRDAS
jgi:hypothetical protein